MIKKPLLVALLAGLALAQTPGPRPVTSEEKRLAVAELAKLVRARYAVPETAETAARTIESKFAQGAYDAIRDAKTFGEAVTNDLRTVTRDKHLVFGLPADPPSSSASRPTSEEIAADRVFRNAEIKRGNFGLTRAEVLPGNVGFLEVRRFQAPELTGDTIAAAVGFLANCEAVIVDLRNCRGGSAYVMPIFAGYFLSRPTSLYDMVFRGDDFTERFWTPAWLSGKRLADVPMYILTSGYTFSGAEGLAYRFQVLKRAVIVGETTGGGANAGGVLDVGPVFRVWLPMGRPVDAETGTNWEGTGVIPDIRVDARDALGTAHIAALNALKAKAATERDQARFVRALERAEASLRHDGSTDASLALRTGVFGPCRVWAEGGQLRIQRGTGPPFLLVPLSAAVYVSETSDPVRLEFVSGSDGRFSKIIFTDEDGIRGEYLKDGTSSAK